MSGLLSTMSIGVRGLSASQLALNITSQNISNANTEGYSRKRLNQVSDFRRDPQFGQMGFGVEVTSITRIRDFFIDRQINRQTTELNYFKEIDNTLTRMENVFGEPSDTTLSKALDQFWNSWSDLGNNPESVAARDVVKANSQVLIDTFHNLSKEMRNLRESKNDDIAVTVTQVNQYLKEIYNLNREISIVEISGADKANDARDQRDLAIKKLSELINITTEDAGQGVVSVLTNGNMLVSPTSYVTLETSTVSGLRPDGTSYSTIGVRFSSTKKDYMPQSGKLRGLVDSRDIYVPQYEAKLDEVANSIVTQVNSLHSRGYNMNGVTGIDFFKVNSHDEQVPRHTEIVDDYTIAFNPASLPTVPPRDMGTPNINSGTVEVRNGTSGLLLTAGTDYTIDLNKGTIILLPSAYMTSLPAPPNTPNILVSYSYDVPKGPQTVYETYASNIELSASIEDDVINMAAASGSTTRAFNDTISIGATGFYQYVHRSAGADGLFGTPDDDPDGIAGSGDELRERSAIKQGTMSVTSGATVLRENADYFVDYSTGRIILFNAAYAGSPLSVQYEASVSGSNGVSDNANAVAISELRHTKLMSPDATGTATATLNTFYDSFISELGVQRNEFTANSDSRQFLVEQFEAKQAEIAGVSLDEELANLVKFQHTYQASARVISTVDKMLDVLFNM
ncbi:MAG: flagellar hook-associated protein FlgK [Fibrobacterota bacterium]